MLCGIKEYIILTLFGEQRTEKENSFGYINTNAVNKAV